MPFVRIAVDESRSPAERKAISDGVYESLIEAVNAPKDDRFHVITSHASDIEQKKLIFKTIADKLAAKAGMRREDVMIMLIDTPKENWSYGNGEAQFAPGP